MNREKTAVSLVAGQMSSQGANMAKLIATVSVIFGHSYTRFHFFGTDYQQFVHAVELFVRACVPVFFLLSGFYLMRRDSFSWKKNMKKKLTSLVVPYVLWTLLYAGLEIIGYHIRPGMFDDYTVFTYKDWFNYLIGVPFAEYPRGYVPLWFLRDLIILNFLTLILVPLVKALPGALLIPLMFLLEVLPLPACCRYAVPFFVIGMVLGRKKEVPVFNVWITSIAGVLCFVGAFFAKVNNCFLDRLLVIPTVFVVISAAEYMVKNQKMSAAVTKLIPFSFITYLTHLYPLALLQKIIISKIAPGADDDIVLYFVLPFVVFGLCCCFAMLFKRLMPRVYGVLVGSR